MSIILKGIDLPDEKLMEMFESDNHICIGGNYYPLMIKDVIQIPKDHGRLIDGDYLQEVLESNKCPESLVFDFIKSEPTILEAET